MADGMDAYIASLRLAQPVQAYEAGAHIAATRQSIQQEAQAQAFKNTMSIIGAQDTARQQGTTNNLARQRIDAGLQEAADRRATMSAHYAQMVQNKGNGYIPPPPMDDSSSPQASPPYSSIAPDTSYPATGRAAEAEAVLQSSQPPTPLSPYAMAAQAGQGAGMSPYSDAGASMPGFDPQSSDLPDAGPKVDLPDIQGRPQPMTQPGAGEVADGGGLLPPVQQDQTQAAKTTSDGKPFNKIIRTGPQTAVVYNQLPNGDTEVVDHHWNGKVGAFVPAGTSKILKSSVASWVPPTPVEGDEPIKGMDSSVTNLGSGIGTKIYTVNGTDRVQEMAWNGKPLNQGGAWKPRGVAISLPKPTSDADLPEAKVVGNVTIFPLPKDKGGWTWKTVQTPPDVQARVQTLQDQGFDVDKVTDAGNGRIALHGVKLVANGSKAVDGSPAKLIGTLPAADKNAAGKAMDILLDPIKGTRDPDTKQPMPPSAAEKAQALGKAPEQMTPPDWQTGYAAALQKRREVAANDLAARLNAYHTGNNKGYTPRTGAYWLHYADGVLKNTDGPDAAPDQQAQAQPPAGLPPSATPPVVAPAAATAPAVGSGVAPAWMAKLGIKMPSPAATATAP